MDRDSNSAAGSAFFIDWKLTSFYDRQHCLHEPAAREANTVFSRKRLLSMADALLNLEKPVYAVRFSGGEPGLHPYLPDLARHFVARGAWLTLATGGWGQAALYKELVRSMPAGHLALEFTLYPQVRDLTHVLLLAGAFAESRQRVHFRVILHSGAQPAERLAVLLRLRQALPFTLETLPLQMAGQNLASGTVPPEFLEAAASGPAIPAEFSGQPSFWPGVDGGPAPVSGPDGNSLRIFPDGSHALSLTASAPAGVPLWRFPVILPVQSAVLGQRKTRAAQPQALSELARLYSAESRFHFQVREAGPDMRKRLERALGAIPGADSRKVFLDALRAVDDVSPDLAATLVERAESRQTGDRDFFVAEQPLRKGEIQDLTASLRQRRPWLRFPVRRGSGDLLDIPLAILDNAPDYEFQFQRGEDGLVWVSAKSRIAPIAGPRPKISIIVPTFNSEATIERCLASLLIQTVPNIEIIVVDDGSTDSTPEKLQEFARIYPDLVKISLQQENRGPGFARNLGLDLATGEFLTFVDSDDMLAEDFLAESLELIERENADIAAFDLALVDPEKGVRRWGVETGLASGEESLRRLLLKQGGCYATYSRLYRADMVKANGIRYGNQAVHQDIFFSAQAFYHSSRTVFTDAIGYYRYLGPNSHSKLNHGKKRLESFFGAVGFLEDFFRVHGLDPEDEALRFAIRRIYDWDRRHIFAYLGNERTNPEAVFTPELVNSCLGSRQALLCVLEDYALLNSHARQVFPVPDTESGAPHAAGPIIMAPFGNAERPAAIRPLVSVIVVSHNQAGSIGSLLESIFSQTAGNFEIVLVDDCSDDGSYELGREMAADRPALRLYRMQNRALSGACRNLALEKARGKYLVFADGELEPGFLEVAGWLAQKRNADIGLFSWKTRKGDAVPAERLEDGVISPQAALALYFQNGIAPGIGAKIFDADFIRSSGARFAQGQYQDEQAFLVEALRKAGRIFTSSFEASIFSVPGAPGADSVKCDYLQINSGCRIFRDLADLAASSASPALALCQRVIWNLENAQLDAWKAFLDAEGQIRLAEGDRDAVLDNGLFAASLLLGLSRKYEHSYNAQSQVLQYVEREGKACVWQFDAPLLTAIITGHDHEGTLAACLDSVLGQSLRSCEIIIVDDASTDNSLRICEQYATLDNRIRVIRNESRKGEGFSRNIALAESRGQYVTFIRGNARIRPDFFLRGVARLHRAQDAQLVQFAAISPALMQKLKRAWDGAIHLDSEQLLSLYCEGVAGCDVVEGKIYRSGFVREAGAAFQEHVYGDELFLLNAYRRTTLALLCDEAMYERSEDSVMQGQGFGHRQIAGYFSANAEISGFFRQLARPGLTEKGLRVRYERNRGRILGYLGRIGGLPIKPFPDAELEDLRQAPELFRSLFSDYARLWSRQRPLPAMPQAAMKDREEFRPELLTIHDLALPDQTPLLSIVIPAWNTEETLRRCVESALAQGEDAEIILIEDNSDRDATFLLAKALAGKSRAIRLFRTRRNSGLGNVRNLGMAVARGKYVTFLDSDDWLGPAFAVSLRPLLLSGGPEIISCSITRVLRNRQSTRLIKPDCRQPGWQTLVELMEGKYSHWEAWGRVFRLDFLRDNDIRFSGYVYEDVQFHFKAFLLARHNLLSSVNSVWSDRRGLQSLMNVARRGRFFFDSQIYNLKITHELANRLCEPELRGKLLEKYADWLYQEDNIFRKDVLTFIDACRLAGYASPLDDATVGTLLLSGPFLNRVLADMGALWEEE